MRYRFVVRAVLRHLLVTLLALLSVLAHASVGLAQIEGLEDDGPVTVFYPSSGQPSPSVRAELVEALPPWLALRQAQGERGLAQGERGLAQGERGLAQGERGLAQGERLLIPDAPAVRGNSRLVVLSHGSGGAPWVHTHLAQRLVETGFIVAVPEHQGDNWHDGSKVGPASWKRRPAEVSRAIDAVARDARFAPLLSLDRVGMYGMSAGGHTALTLAGGRWSPSVLLKHCEAHLSEDFQTCVGLATRLRGDLLDGAKKLIALSVIRYRMSDATWYTHEEPRIKAVVADVPFAADFDLQSLARPRVALGFVISGQDIWLPPRFHARAVLDACTSCEVVADLPTAGHGSLLSPQPPRLSGLLAELLGDPHGFDRSAVPAAHEAIVEFFRRHLVLK